MRHENNNLAGYPEGGDLGLNDRIILNYILEK
jgi:hypothetical protein